MVEPVLLDSGFLVALVNAGDPQHADCVEVWSGLRAPILSVEGVLIEATHVLRRVHGGAQAALGIAVSAGVELVAADAARLARAAVLMRRYHETPMDLVDALLVTVAGSHEVDQVLTLDVRGFSTYRWKGTRPFRLLPTPGPAGRRRGRATRSG